jgi:hypothetical protein
VRTRTVQQQLLLKRSRILFASIANRRVSCRFLYLSRVAVAPAGTTVLDEQGEELQVTKTTVGGVMSEGMLCDSRMLGWSGGAAGLAVQIPNSIALGSSPPATKPRGVHDSKPTEEEAQPQEQQAGLFEKKLTKEEKKKMAEEKRKAKKAAKEAKQVDEETNES